MNHVFRFLMTSLWMFGSPLIAADLVLVKDGQPRAQIVISENPARTTRLAAHELQTYVEKISRAKLPIVTQPGDEQIVKLFIGRSDHTDRREIDASGLKHGAYRIVSGNDWLAFIGDDTDFTPIEPWARNNTEIVNGKAQAEWDKITGAQWGVPGILMYKQRGTFPGDIGLPTEQAAAGKKVPLQLWCYDERGSFNAVCGWLQRLGVRWYLPGELGEIVPTLKTIMQAPIDEIVRPDFPLRRFNFRFATVSHDTAMWSMRLGTRDPFEIQDAHGLDNMTNRAEVFAAHPDWFALYGGKRRYDPKANNQLCYSNEELFQETVRYVKAQFDHYKLDAVSIMPPDGYTAICQCKLCEGKDSPERDQRGLLSDYVWGFVNRVAKEVGKTHPDRKVLNCAYGVYTLPPLKIEKLEPNVVVSIVGARVPRNNKPEQQEELRKLRESWVAKTSNPLINFENYPFTDRGWYLPAFTPHSMGSSINALKGISQGEDIWLTIQHDFDKNGIGLNHFQVYFNARMYWGGKEQDVDAMFREYCRLFYGPAEQEMRAFFEYSEANWQEMEKDKSKVDRVLELFAAAKTKVDPGSVYGRRLAHIDDFLKGLRSKSTQLAKKRGPVPQLRLVGEATSKIVIDGKLDDDAWVNCPIASTVRLRELQTGRQPTFGTTVKSAWIGNNVYFAIRCDEHPGEKLNITATKKDDSAMWYGDVVEVLLETESRSYYQLAINPAGAVADLDRSAARNAWFGWDAQAEVVTHIADDHWTVELRIPVTQDENDPLNRVIGRKPDKSLPWHFNVCRQRIREKGEEYSAFSPTGTDGFHELMKFAHYYDGNSHQFDAAEPEADYLEATRIAANLARTGKHEAALAAYVAATGFARSDPIYRVVETTDRMNAVTTSDLQKSAALEQAAASARLLRKHDVAAELAVRIPIDAVKKSVLMQNLLDQFKAKQVIEQFGSEDIANWPFWKAGDGYFNRGHAYAITKAGQEAETDLLRALEWTSDPRIRDSIRQSLGGNRETNLKDDTAALATYHEIIDNVKQLGSADHFNAVQGIARIQTRRGKFEDALAALRKVEIDKLTGFWRGSMRLAVGDTLRAAGRKEEAAATYKSIIADETIDARHRTIAEDSLAKLRE